MLGKRLAVLALIFAFVFINLSSSQALAARAGGGGGKKVVPNTGSFSLVLVDSTDGVAHWGQHVTFAVASSATYAFVRVDCYRGGAWVYEQSIGFYVGWPWSKNFTLMSAAWTAGVADCDALLYSTSADGSNFQALAPLSFHVND